MGGLAKFALCVPLLAGCGAASFACDENGQCEGGRCEPEGWCSFPDAECPSGHRFGDFAGGGLAGECTDNGAGTTDVTASATDISTTGPLPGTESADDETATAPTTLPASGSSEGTGPPLLPVCGDELVEGDEDCDDGNALDGDGCNNDCVFSGSLRWSTSWAGPDGMADRLHEVVVSDTEIVAAGRSRIAAGVRGLIIRATHEGEVSDTIVQDGSGADGHANFLDIELMTGGDMMIVGEDADDMGEHYAWIGRFDSSLSEVWSHTDGPGRFWGVTVADSFIAAGGSEDNMTGETPRVRLWSFDGDRMTVVVDSGGEQGYLRRVAADGDNVYGIGTYGSGGDSLGKLMSIGLTFLPVFNLDPLPNGWSEFQGLAVAEGDLVAGGWIAVPANIQERSTELRRMSTSGSVIWEHTDVGGDGTDEIEALVVDSNGDVIVAGVMYESFQVNAMGFVRRYDAQGNIRWTTRIDIAQEEYLRGVALAPDGDIVVAGTTGELGEGEDAFIARLAP